MVRAGLWGKPLRLAEYLAPGCRANRAMARVAMVARDGTGAASTGRLIDSARR